MIESVRQDTYYGDTVAPRCAWVNCPGPRITITGRTASRRELPLWVINSNRLILKRRGMFCQGSQETSGSLIERLLPKSILAVTAAGLDLNSVLSVLALIIGFLKVAIRAVTA